MNEPLAQRLRPKTLADVCGQQHLLAEGQVFRRTIESGRIPNMIFYGPSGTGKTTVARIIAENSGMTLHKLNGTSCGISDIKAVLKDIGTLAGAGASCSTSTRYSTSTKAAAEPSGVHRGRFCHPYCIHHREPLLLHL